MYNHCTAVRPSILSTSCIFVDWESPRVYSPLFDTHTAPGVSIQVHSETRKVELLGLENRYEAQPQVTINNTNYLTTAWQYLFPIKLVYCIWHFPPSVLRWCLLSSKPRTLQAMGFGHGENRKGQGVSGYSLSARVMPELSCCYFRRARGTDLCPCPWKSSSSPTKL